MPDPAFSSLYVVPDFPSMLFSNCFTTSSLLHLLSLHRYSVVCHILLIIPVLGGEFPAHSCNTRRLSCLEVTRGLWENGRNVLCNVGATQPIGIFLPPPSCKSMQLCGFAIFSTLFVIVHAMDLLPTPLLPPLLLPTPSVFPIIIWTGGLPAPDVRRSTYPLIPYSPHILCLYPRPFLAGFPLNSTHPLCFYIFLACYCLHLNFLKFFRFLRMSCARRTDFLSTL